MSYILDALRKADAQRAGNPARGIHAQPAALPTVSQPRPMKLWISIAAALLVLTAGVGVWWLGEDAAGTPAAARATPAAATPPPATTTVVVAAPPPAAMVLPPAPPVVQAPVAVAKPPLQPAAAAAAATAAQVAVATAAPAASSRIYTMAELPADAQQAFPKLSISGGVYSDNVAQRMLIVDGQVFNEGSEIAPGVVLEQVRARTAVLKFRGLRLSQPY